MNTRDAGRDRRTEHQPLEFACPICRRRIVILERDLSSENSYCPACGVHLLRVRERRHVSVRRPTRNPEISGAATASTAG